MGVNLKVNKLEEGLILWSDCDDQSGGGDGVRFGIKEGRNLEAIFCAKSDGLERMNERFERGVPHT